MIKTIYNRKYYSNSIVLGGFEEISSTTLLIPLTELTILFEILVKKFLSKEKKSAVIPSTEVTALIKQIYS